MAEVCFYPVPFAEVWQHLLPLSPLPIPDLLPLIIHHWDGPPHNASVVVNDSATLSFKRKPHRCCVDEHQAGKKAF